MGTILLSIGDRVDPEVYELHSRFEHACNFLNAQHLVCVVDASIGAGPMNIVLTRIPAQAANMLSVGRDSVLLGERRIRFTERHQYHSAVHIRCSCPERFHRNLSALRSCLVETAPPESLVFLIDEIRNATRATGFAEAFAAKMERAVHELFYGDLLASIAGLKGCGPGLTPSGDDFIAGVLIGLHVVQQISRIDLRDAIQAIVAAAVTSNVFSNNFLDCAHKGLISERVKSAITTITEGSPVEVPAATKRLLALGSTSGADLAIGLYMTLCNQGEFARRYQQNLHSGADEIRVLPCLATMEVGA